MIADPTSRRTMSQALRKHNVDKISDVSYHQTSWFISGIDSAAGRPKHKHDKHHEISASTVNLSDPMKVELDAILQAMAAEKQSHRAGKASVGLEGVGEWARTCDCKEGWCTSCAIMASDG